MLCRELAPALRASGLNGDLLDRFVEGATQQQLANRVSAAQAVEALHQSYRSISFDRTAPLAAALLRKGLTEELIVQDNWTAQMSLPRNAVNGIMSATLSDDDKAALEQHATLDVLKVKPSSALSCELWCRFVGRFAIGPKAQVLLGTVEVREALVAAQVGGADLAAPG